MDSSTIGVLAAAHGNALSAGGHVAPGPAGRRTRRPRRGPRLLSHSRPGPRPLTWGRGPAMSVPAARLPGCPAPAPGPCGLGGRRRLAGRCRCPRACRDRPLPRQPGCHHGLSPHH
ncbi:hypothetical protein [Streptomyces sp. NBC_01571]|uniref:hypothetical protein n=1 Tax=Streptomyces sp. NBC_01571 TaxID=2975883 RepID=UPI00338D5F13